MCELKKTIVTGASGYVGNALARYLPSAVGIDFRDSKQVQVNCRLSQIPDSDLNIFTDSHVIHLAAARTDVGLSLREYEDANINETEAFLSKLDDVSLRHFLHVSSVAALDGSRLTRDGCETTDDYYRYTKFTQEQIVREWCLKKKVPLAILYPSAIYDPEFLGCTNVARLHKIAKLLPILPDIRVTKSLTSLDRFCDFIVDVSSEKLTGDYLCIEHPIMTVSEIMQSFFPNKKVVALPFLKPAIMFWASLSSFISPTKGLTRSRAIKLFKSTDYAEYELETRRYRFNE